MKFVIGGIWIIICVSVLIAMLSGRIKLRSCCGATDAACDLRLRDRGEAESEVPVSMTLRGL
jgi:hypothetical protein